MVAIILVFVVFFIYGIYSKIYNSKTHTNYGQHPLKENAKVVDVKTKTVGLKGDHKFRTTVTFDDGFEYISHDTIRTEKVFSYQISITKEMEKAIVARAQFNHDQLIKNRDGTSEEPEKIYFQRNKTPVESPKSKPNKFEEDTWQCGKCGKRNVLRATNCWNCNNPKD